MITTLTRGRTEPAAPAYPLSHVRVLDDAHLEHEALLALGWATLHPGAAGGAPCPDCGRWHLDGTTCPQEVRR